MDAPRTSAVPLSSCRFCGGSPGHAVERCPQVVGIEYHPDGSIKRVDLGNRFAPVIQPPPVVTTPFYPGTPLPPTYPTWGPNICQAVR